MSAMMFKKKVSPDFKRDISTDAEVELFSASHLSKYALELRELEFQSSEYQRIAEKLLREGQIIAVNEVNAKRAHCRERIIELREILINAQSA